MQHLQSRVEGAWASRHCYSIASYPLCKSMFKSTRYRRKCYWAVCSAPLSCTHCESCQHVGPQPHSNPHTVGHAKVLHHTVDLFTLLCHSRVAEQNRPRARKLADKGPLVSMPTRDPWSACRQGTPGQHANKGPLVSLPTRDPWSACQQGTPGQLADKGPLVSMPTRDPWSACRQGTPGQLANKGPLLSMPTRDPWSACRQGTPGQHANSAAYTTAASAVSDNSTV